MAKQQKHLLKEHASRSLSKNKLMNFIKPTSTKQSPLAANKIEIQAEMNI
jgi:hypothetical protein